MVWGVTVAVLCVPGNILNVAAGNGMNGLPLVLGIVFPAPYIVGAARNEKGAMA